MSQNHEKSELNNTKMMSININIKTKLFLVDNEGGVLGLKSHYHPEIFHLKNVNRS